MTVTGTEYLVSTVRNPYTYIVGSSLVAVPAYNTGISPDLHEFTVADLTTMVGKNYTGIGGHDGLPGVTIGDTVYYPGATTVSGYQHHYCLMSIDTGTLTASKLTALNSFYGTIVAVDSDTICGQQKYVISTATLSII